MLEQRDLLSFIPFNTVSQWVEAGLLVEIPGRWGRPLAPVGAIVRLGSGAKPGPLLDFVDELLRARNVGTAG